jgi:HK97 gp10 family phage protein
MENKWNDKIVLAHVRQKILDKLEVAGQYVEDSAKLLCPVGETEMLRGSIHHVVNNSELSVRIGTNTEYAPYLEFGTGEFAESGDGRKGGWYYVDDKGVGHFTFGNKPQPFLRPALYGNKKKITEIMEL